MQIPRGTFRELKKGIEFSTLLEEMRGDKFTGYCNIISNEVSVLMVHQDGKVLLAKCDDLRGDQAWQKIQRLSTSHVDAALSDPTPQQVNLALEFNTAGKITHSRKIREHNIRSETGQKQQ